MMITPSEEQQRVIDAIKDGYNVQVDAVAGSGKTTTVLSLADQNTDKMIIQLTYNTELKEEVIEKKRKYGEIMYLDNLSIHTYHSFAYQFYTMEAKTDIGINKILEEKLSPRKKLPNIDVLVLDEVQDMNALYYEFVMNLVRDINKSIQILVLGDNYQGLYEFKGADTRYLTYAHKIWNISPFPFKILKLSTSYRLTNQMAFFVNHVMLGDLRIQTCKLGLPVGYIRHPNAYQNYKIIGCKLIQMIDSGEIKPQDIFILSASVKGENSPIKYLENMLVRNHIPCYVPMSETSSIHSDIIKNKVIFSSIHQSKGRERKIVVVYGFDEDYFHYFYRDSDRSQCPSTLYVATTRATQQLLLLEMADPLPFLKYTHVEMSHCPDIDFEGVPQGIKNNVVQERHVKVKQPTFRKLTPTSMIKFLNESVLNNIVKIMETHLFTTDAKSYPLNEVKIPTSIQSIYYNHEITEEVNDINGIAIPALFEEKYNPLQKKTNTIKEYVQTYIEKNPNHTFYKNKVKHIDFENTSLEDHLKLANIYISIRENLNFKVAQIKEYGWLQEKMVKSLFLNMERHIENPRELEYEVPIIDYTDPHYQEIDAFVEDSFGKGIDPFRFCGRVDAMTSTTIWEFKCTDTIEPEHQLQVVIYAWLWKMTREKIDGPRVFKLLNIKTAEVQTLSYKEEYIDSILLQILKSKYTVQNRMSDEEFIMNCNKIGDK
jgi:hypothetical protein